MNKGKLDGIFLLSLSSGKNAEISNLQSVGREQEETCIYLFDSIQAICKLGKEILSNFCLCAELIKLF